MTINYVIVEIDEAYKNYIETENSKIYTNSTIESVSNINRAARVIEAPKFTILKEGNEIITHHNIFRLRYGATGSVIKSNYWLEGNKYFVPLTEVFMVKKPNEEWEALSPYCFIKPLKYEDKKIGNIILPSDSAKSHKGRIKQIGVIEYPNAQMVESGLNVGDKVGFSKNSEYEFNINGEILYKMSSKDIMMKF